MNAFREWLNFLMVLLTVTGPSVLIMVAILEDFRKYMVPAVLVYTWVALMVINVFLNIVGIFLALLFI